MADDHGMLVGGERVRVAALARTSASASGSMPGTGEPNGSARQASNGAPSSARAPARSRPSNAPVIDLGQPLVDASAAHPSQSAIAAAVS